MKEVSRYVLTLGKKWSNALNEHYDARVSRTTTDFMIHGILHMCSPLDF